MGIAISVSFQIRFATNHIAFLWVLEQRLLNIISFACLAKHEWWISTLPRVSFSSIKMLTNVAADLWHTI